jgi:hypothetical protein
MAGDSCATERHCGRARGIRCTAQDRVVEALTRTCPACGNKLQRASHFLGAVRNSAVRKHAFEPRMHGIPKRGCDSTSTVILEDLRCVLVCVPGWMRRIEPRLRDRRESGDLFFVGTHTANQSPKALRTHLGTNRQIRRFHTETLRVLMSRCEPRYARAARNDSIFIRAR